MITTFYPPYSFGGDAVYIYRLANELARLGHQVDVIHCKDSYSVLRSTPPTVEYPNHSNVTVYGLKSRVGFLSPLLTQQTGAPFFKRKKIKTLIEKNNYDVIHFHNMSLIGISALQYGKAVKLYTMHEHWLVCPMHVLWKFNREVCTERSCLTCQLVGKRPPQLWRYTGLFDRMLPHVNLFISPSRFTLQKHHELGFNLPIVHLPYFLPQQEPQSNEVLSESVPGDEPYFLFVGRLEKIKGLQNVIPVFKKRPQYKLLIAGDGDFENELKEIAGDAPNIQFLGKLSHARLRQLYANAIAVIVPSICYEVFGIIIIEAFSVKTPVIVNNLGALPEVVQDSDGGFIYNSEGELIAAMAKLAEDRRLRNRLGESGYRAYLSYWDEKSHIRKYFGLIEELQKKH